MQHIRSLTLGDAKVRAIVLAGIRRLTGALLRGDGDRAAAATRANLHQAKKAFIDAAGLTAASPAKTRRTRATPGAGVVGR